MSSEGALEEARRLAEGLRIMADEMVRTGLPPSSREADLRSTADTLDSLSERLRRAAAALEAFRENCRCTHAHEAADRLLALDTQDTEQGRNK